MNGLALREHVRMLLVARLRRCKPLQGGALLCSCHIDAQRDLKIIAMRRFYSQRAAVRFYPAGGDAVVQGTRACTDGRNIEETIMCLSNGAG